MAIAEFANALLIIPKVLASNAAKDSSELISKLRSFHSFAQSAPAGDPKKSLRFYGLDLYQGVVRDNRQAGVLEPTLSKVKSFKAALEACTALLRIDDSIVVPKVSCYLVALNEKVVNDLFVGGEGRAGSSRSLVYSYIAILIVVFKLFVFAFRRWTAGHGPLFSIRFFSSFDFASTRSCKQRLSNEVSSYEESKLQIRRSTTAEIQI